MCKAIEDLAKEFEARGEARGLERGRFNTLMQLVLGGLITPPQAAATLGITENEFRTKMSEADELLRQ